MKRQDKTSNRPENRGGRRVRRSLDLGLALVLGLLLGPAIAVLAVALGAGQGRPVFHLSERMRDGGRAFRLMKFRTMRPAPGGDGITGGGASQRITPLGRLLRASRADEMPQLWNILKGEMSFVGPRPPLRRYVEMFPDLYARVLALRPGVTGLASLVYHRHEERLLAQAATSGEAARIYARRCVPRKARLDLIWLRHRSIGFDLWLIWLTFARGVRLLPKTGRLPRPPGSLPPGTAAARRQAAGARPPHAEKSGAPQRN